MSLVPNVGGPFAAPAQILTPATPRPWVPVVNEDGVKLGDRVQLRGVNSTAQRYGHVIGRTDSAPGTRGRLVIQIEPMYREMGTPALPRIVIDNAGIKLYMRSNTVWVRHYIDTRTGSIYRAVENTEAAMREQTLSDRCKWSGPAFEEQV